MKLDNEILQGDALEVLKTLEDESVSMCMTSPPYWALRDYGSEGQLGLEPTFQEYINRLCDIFDEVKRVLKKDGTCWVNLGDTYSAGGGGPQANERAEKGIKWSEKSEKNTHRQSVAKGFQPKCLLQIPNRFAIEMTNRGWTLRNEIIWHKPSCMPASVTDRFTVDFEKVFLFSKNKQYYFEQQLEPFASEPEGMRNKGNENFGKNALGGDKRAMSEGERDWYIKGKRNKRCVWSINPKPFSEAHFAVYPEELCWTPIKAGCPEGGIILDPFFGAGTTGLVAKKLSRKYLGIELNPEYIKLAKDRLAQQTLF